MRQLTITLKAAAAFCVIYLAMAFFSTSIDFTKWTEGERLLTLLLGSYLAFAVNVRDFLP